MLSIYIYITCIYDNILWSANIYEVPYICETNKYFGIDLYIYIYILFIYIYILEGHSIIDTYHVASEKYSDLLLTYWWMHTMLN